MESKKLLVVGDFTWPWYEEAFCNASESLGLNVAKLSWFNDFYTWIDGDSSPHFLSFFHRIQLRLHSGPIVGEINRRLIKTALEFKPDIVWFYNVQLISARMVRKLRKLLPDAVLCQYSNDNPFSTKAKFGLWHNFLASMRYFDLHFVYRQSNIADHKLLGFNEVHQLRSYFIPEVDYPEPQENIPESFKCDVVFAGHYEDDGRLQMLEAICKAGFKLNLFGGGWNRVLPSLDPESPLHPLFPICPMTGPNYRYAICGAKVALCFLSTLNNDTYTRRSFQIPAMKTAMLSEYTADLESIFKPNVEAVFFNNQKELLNKLETLLQDDDKRSIIAKAGYARVYSDGHDVRSRMVEWIKHIQNKI